tara:strand:+ start:133 stop:867 length:735 start_codon:yes stop_codon:yes gene_type:complete
MSSDMVEKLTENSSQLTTPPDFSLEEYLKNVELIIKKILLSPEKENLTFDILDTPKSKKNKLLALKEKQRQMKIGEIWQEVIGNYKDFIDLGIGHKTGLDILSNIRKLAIELKNRTTTDNDSSKKSNLYKLAKFKKEHPDFTVIYANINEDTEEKTKNMELKLPTNAVLKELCREHKLAVSGKKEELVKRLKDKNIEIPYEKKTILHNGVEIEHQVGYQFLTFIFGENTEEIIEFVKNIIDKYT